MVELPPPENTGVTTGFNEEAWCVEIAGPLQPAALAVMVDTPTQLSG